jgi:DNA-binding Xre family transcriptional regulator
MSRRDLHPLSTAAARKIELATAHLEVEIHDAVLAWYSAAPANGTGLRTLTAEQQSELQNLLIKVAVLLGEAEGCEYLNVTSSPRQFVTEVAQLMDAITAETLDRWKSLTRDFGIEPQFPEDGNAESAFYLLVREALKPAARRLIRDAWSAHEKRLAAEYACSAAKNGRSARQPPSDSPHPNQSRWDMVAKRVEQLRIDRGMSIEELAVEARLDKKTVAALIDGSRRARINTVKKLADALGVKASELVV